VLITSSGLSESRLTIWRTYADQLTRPNSDPAQGNDDLGTLAGSVYQALQKAGAAQGS
jgi:hypothetical protein